MEHRPVVLIIDDEPMDIQLMRDALEQNGFETSSAARYEDALQRFQERSGELALLLVDVSLPGRNGVDVAKELLRRSPELRVLFVSGHVGAEVIRFYGMKTTDQHFLRKPFTAGQLLGRVHLILQAPQTLPWLDADNSHSQAGHHK